MREPDIYKTIATNARLPDGQTGTIFLIISFIRAAVEQVGTISPESIHR